MSEDIPIIPIDENFPQCPHCKRFCEDVYEIFDKEFVEVADVKPAWDSYHEIRYEEWLTIITCPDCGGKFQFEDANA